MRREKRPAIFLDRDGTISVDVGYIDCADKLELFANSVEGLGVLQAAGYKLIIVTNQSGVARGYFSIERVEEINEALNKILSDSGIKITGVYYCPYHVSGIVEKYSKESDCRKPDTGMVIRAVEEHDIDLSRSVMIGDKMSDILCGKNAGMKAVLVRTGFGQEEEDNLENLPELQRPDHISDDLGSAALWITSNFLE